MSEEPFLDHWRELRTVRGLDRTEALSVILLMREGPLSPEDLEELQKLAAADRLEPGELAVLAEVLEGGASSK